MGRCRLCTSAVAVTAALLVIIRTHAAPLERRLQHPQLTRATGLEVLQQARSPLGLKTKRPEAFNHLMMPVTTLRGGSSDRHEAALESSSRTGLRHCSKVCSLFLLSYMFSVGFNVNNKRASLLVPLPWTYASMNLLIGTVMALLSWSINASPWPRLRPQDIRVLVPIGLLHAVSHLTVVLGLGAGAVSFVHTVKASEACFTALLSFLLLGQTLPLPVYFTLIPVVVGVGITSCNQIRFSWLALFAALLSNLSNALRNVLVVKNIGPGAAVKVPGKAAVLRERNGEESQSIVDRRYYGKSPTGGKIGRDGSLANTPDGAEEKTEGGLFDLAPGDTYRLTTMVGTILLFPVAACLEHGSWPSLWRGATEAAVSAFANAPRFWAGTGDTDSSTSAGEWTAAFKHAVMSGVCFNLFYDVSFRLLGQLHPVTHAVGNTVKRVIVIGAGAVAFGGGLGGPRGAMGSALAIVGVLAYSVAKARYR